MSHLFARHWLTSYSSFSVQPVHLSLNCGGVFAPRLFLSPVVVQLVGAASDEGPFAPTGFSRKIREVCRRDVSLVLVVTYGNLVWDPLRSVLVRFVVHEGRSLSVLR